MTRRPPSAASRRQRSSKPTAEQLAAAAGKRLPDIVGPGLRILMVGINPSLYSVAVGHHFARPGNRFWPAMHRGGFTEAVLSPFEDHRLLEVGVGLTNIASRATARADELLPDELLAGARALARKVARLRPRWVAFLGISAYRVAFDRRKAALGRQEERIASAGVWVLPNPSGLNAHYQLPQLGELFAALRRDGLLARDP